MNKTAKQIIAVLIIGCVLIVADIVMSDEEGVEVEGSNGQLQLIRPEAGSDSGYLSLKAEVKGEKGVYEKVVNIRLEPYEKETDEETMKQHEDDGMLMSAEEQLDYDLRMIADGVNKDVSKKKVSLPAKLDTGETVTWTVEETAQTNTLVILLLMISSMVIIYRERNSAARKKEAGDRESVLSQLPGFINRLVLLLNAGMVINSAFEKAVQEGAAGCKDDTDYFYQNMKGIHASMNKANGSMGKELKEFARRSGVQELMRISNIINDNLNKGTELTHKLQSESELLWLGRKKRCEELGKLAETKLTLPLLLFLLVLIVITIAPALLEL